MSKTPEKRTVVADDGTIYVEGNPENGYCAQVSRSGVGKFTHWAMDFDDAIKGVRALARGESKPFPDMPDPAIVVTDTGHAWAYKLHSSLRGEYFYSADQMRKVIEERDELKWRMEGLEK